jgi:hypothetical protein
LLPVSGLALAVREPTGRDELYVVESALPPRPAFLGLARRVASTADGRPVDWPALPATDLDAAALLIRQAWIGDAIETDVRCPQAGCQDRIDVSFRVSDYLEHHRPRRPRGVTPSPEPGWLTLAGADVRFRVPSVADVLAAAPGGPRADALADACIEPPRPSRAVARRLSRALAALAPSLTDVIGGACPGCGREVTLRFDPLGYLLAELRDAFAGLYAEAHALAAAYGWPEAAILDLPRGRRQRYAALVTGQAA